jgi:hypothetical protein
VTSSGFRRLSKLRMMSAQEVASRVTYKVALALERRAHAKGSLIEPDGLRRGLRSPLGRDGWKRRLLQARRETPARFFPSVRDAASMRALFDSDYRLERDRCLAEAARVREGHFEFFGSVFHFPNGVDWQRDPVTGAKWPQVFHADVPVHGGDVGYGDVKHVWELSRQQYVIDLGKAYFLTRDEAWLTGLRALIRSWIDGNPYATGVNWACALEPAFRSWSWLWAYHTTADALDDEFHLEWLDSIRLHGRFLSRHLEHYSSPFNHLIGEASALYAIGVCFPEFADSSAWRKLGRRVLETRLAEQFYEDGGTKEQSTFYHHATLGFYLLAALLGRQNREEFALPVWQAIERGLEFSLQLMMPDGRTPEIGGADDGKPIRLEHLPLWDFRPYLAIVAVALDRPEFKFGAGRFFEDALWLLGPVGRSRFDRLSSRPPADTSATLRSSGYFVARNDWAPDADYVCFDAGEQAAGIRRDGVPNSMHGHADCLSIIATLGGQRVLADSGLFAYNCGGDWEAHFRETAAHNTARVDGRDQALHLGKMAWSQSYLPALEGTGNHAGWWAVGSHDGYARGTNGITHRRAVWLRADHYLVVWDEFEGTGDHDLEVNYQFAQGELVVTGANLVRFSDTAELLWIGPLQWEAVVSKGGPSPDQGWICPSLGVRVEAPRLRLRARYRGARTVLLAALAAVRPGLSRLSSHESSWIRIHCGSAADWVGPDTDGGPMLGLPAVLRLSSDGTVLERAALLDRAARVDDASIRRTERTLAVPSA